MATIHWVRALTVAVSGLGISPQTLLGHAGVEASVLENDAFRPSLRQEEALLQSAIELTGDAAFGLHWGESADVRPWGPVSLMVAYAPTFREVIATLGRYVCVFSDGVEVASHERGGKLAVRLTLSPEKPALCARAQTELLMAGLVRILRNYVDHASAFHEVFFAYPRPAHAAAYAVTFSGKERFDASHSEFWVDARILDLKQRGSSDVILKAAQEVAEDHLAQRTGRATFGARVREQLTRSGALGQIDMKDIARALGVSERSLRRRLTEEGVSWPTLLNDARGAQAKRLLDKRTIQEAAFELGFADASAFHRAFKRWTGLTPVEYRRGKGA